MFLGCLSYASWVLGCGGTGMKRRPMTGSPEGPDVPCGTRRALLSCALLSPSFAVCAYGGHSQYLISIPRSSLGPCPPLKPPGQLHSGVHSPCHSSSLPLTASACLIKWCHLGHTQLVSRSHRFLSLYPSPCHKYFLPKLHQLPHWHPPPGWPSTRDFLSNS